MARIADPAAAPRAALKTRAVGYGRLPWVDEAGWFSAALPVDHRRQARGVLDLGCGPARLGHWLAVNGNVPYVGVEASAAMAEQADRRAGLEVIVGDVETLALPRFDGWTFVLANVLHYLRDLGSLRTIPERFGRPERLCLIETESPDRRTLAWARELFDIVWPGYERRWYVAGDLDRLVDELDAEVTHDIIVNQPVHLDAWLAGWDLRQHQRHRAEAHFELADPHVRVALRLERDAAGTRVMRRRQRILHLRLPG